MRNDKYIRVRVLRAFGATPSPKCPPVRRADRAVHNTPRRANPRSKRRVRSREGSTHGTAPWRCVISLARPNLTRTPRARTTTSFKTSIIIHPSSLTIDRSRRRPSPPTSRARPDLGGELGRPAAHLRVRSIQHPPARGERGAPREVGATGRPSSRFVVFVDRARAPPIVRSFVRSFVRSI